MESKIQIDIDIHRQESIRVKWKHSDDLRDTLVNMFLHTATPGFNGTHAISVLDGYCRISFASKNEDGSYEAAIVPIHPIDMPKHIDLIRENAQKFNPSDESPVKENEVHPVFEKLVNSLQP
jgi:hypothetical protein